MTEIRVDPLSGHRSIVAVDRAQRPGAFFAIEPPPAIDIAEDPFAPGHEDETPPEVYAVRPDGSAPDTPGWTVRAVPNRYPALTPDAREPPPEANSDLFTAARATGHHEVIVNAPDAVHSLSDLTLEQVELAVATWRERMRAHADAACRHLIVNERPEAGASLPHTHAQLYAFDFVPAEIARERERFSAYAVRMMGAGNLLGDLVQEEVRRRERIVAVDDEAVLIAPWASRSPLQLLIAPRRPTPRFEDDGPTGAALLHDALRRLRMHLGATPPLNLWLRTAPRGADSFCWRIDIVPRLAAPAGLELGAGVNLCTVAPEAAAAALREL